MKPTPAPTSEPEGPGRGAKAEALLRGASIEGQGRLVAAGEPTEPPVVARLVIEIRADGSQVVARGALEDTESGERVALEARGDTPLGLAGSLLRAMAEAPLLVARASGPVRRAPRNPASALLGAARAPGAAASPRGDGLLGVARSLVARGLQWPRRPG